MGYLPLLDYVLTDKGLTSMPPNDTDSESYIDECRLPEYLGDSDLLASNELASNEFRVLFKPVIRILIETCELLVLALVIFVGIRLVVQNYVVSGDSMLQTFSPNDFLVVNKLAYETSSKSNILAFLEIDLLSSEVRSGDVVVFPSLSGNDYDLIKRVVALEGQSVESRDGEIFVDGYPLPEPYAFAKNYDSWGPIQIPRGFVYVLGDNRGASYDSRTFGPVAKANILGKVVFRYWPPARIGQPPD